MKIALELLAPAKNLEFGKAAIDSGADAVYIGAKEFGARLAAGNSLSDIAELVKYAHLFNAKVFVTINTILFDNELEKAEKLIHELYKIRVDALIIQDMAILEMNLPPIAIHASTQTNNYTLDKVKFFESVGVNRVILARELSYNQIKEIRQSTKVDLEYFIHGALCVSLSGQCYMSHHVGKRSANRGTCAQPCRLKYKMVDANNKTIIAEKHLLSLKDLNNSSNIERIAELGITSFKIEGRLKDISYVKNITSWYSEKLNQFIENNNKYTRASSGKSRKNFVSAPEKSFNRGFSTYFFDGRQKGITSFNTSKSIGEGIGEVKSIEKDHITISSDIKINNGDGLCFFDSNNNLCGFRINRVEGSKLFHSSVKGLKTGIELFRNHNQEFEKELSRETVSRKIDVCMLLQSTQHGLSLTITDTDNNSVCNQIEIEKEAVKSPERQKESIITNLQKTGNTVFEVTEIYTDEIDFFIPASVITNLRRDTLEMLHNYRIDNYKTEENNIIANNEPYPQTEVDYKANVTNKLSQQFYQRHQTTVKEKGFELLTNTNNKELMTTRHCLKFEAGICPKHHHTNGGFSEPMYLISDSNSFQLEFDCKNCLMKVISTSK